MRFFSRVFLPFLLLGYIATETYMKLRHTSLCGEVGCKLAGELLTFDPLYLNYIGLVSVFILMLFGYLSLKYKLFRNLFFIGLYSAIAFETTLLSYQFVVNPEPCLFCLGIFASLLIIALFNQLRSFAIVVGTVVAIFLAFSTLSITKNKVFTPVEGTYLVQSETCPHCKKVKAYFKEHNINYTPISAKEANVRSFLKFVNISSIPVLIIKEKSNITLLSGDKNIIEYFSHKTELGSSSPVAAEPTVSSNTVELSSDFLSAGVADDGCALTITETPSCTDENTTH